MHTDSAFDEEGLVRAGVPVVGEVARHLSRTIPRGPQPADLVGVGIVTLLDAARRHDATRSGFTPFLIERLRWAMLSDVRRSARRARLMARAFPSGGLGSSREDSKPPDGSPGVSSGCSTEQEEEGEPRDPEQVAEQMHNRKRLRRALSELPPKTRIVLVRHYFGGERLDGLAKDLSISKSAATRLHQSGKRMLAARLRDLAPPGATR